MRESADGNWSRRARGVLAAAAAGALIAVGLAGPAAADDEPPSADVLDVDFADGSVIDHARGVEPEVMGEPEVGFDDPLGRYAVSTDRWSDSLHYDIADQYPAIADGLSVECVFRYDGELDTSERGLCNHKEGGGFAMVIFGDQLTFRIHAGGAYQDASITAEAGRWYHALGVWDGDDVQLYIDGELLDSSPASGEFGEPDEAETNLVIGGDSRPNGALHFAAEATVSTARVYSDVLDAGHAQALYAESGIPDGQELALSDTTPSEGDHLVTATGFGITYEDEALLSRSTTYTLDGEQIQPGDMIGPGLAAGEHTLEIDAVDVFGRDFNTQVDFTSANIPEPTGTSTRHGNGSALLSATAEHPAGDRLNTLFTEGALSIAQDGFQGTVDGLPSSLAFDYDIGEDVPGPLQPGDQELAESPSSDDLPFQRFDIEIPADGQPEDQQIVWSGTADPARSVHLMVWDLVAEEWTELASGRGLADEQLSLTGRVQENHIAQETVHAMVLGYDQFEDNLDEPVRDSFEDPGDYDFSIAHLTDSQYLVQGAVLRESEQEREVWRAGYEQIAEWIGDNHEERKIAYAAHTGDLIQSWASPGVHDSPEGIVQARAEFEIASEVQEVLEVSGIPNGVLPGNHDNLNGTDAGPESLYNEYFGPERYEAQAEQESWQQAGASYHPWREGDNDNHYDLFTAGGLEFLALHLGFDVRQEEADWANEVLEQYPDRNALVFTHSYNGASPNPDGRDAGPTADGRVILEEVLVNHRNVAMVMSGHIHGVSIVLRDDVGSSGNQVVELLADYQAYEVGSDELGLTEIGDYDGDTPLRFGASFFRLLQFDVEAGEVSVDTYSPLLDNFGATEYDDRERYDGTEDDFRIPVQLETRTTSFATDGLAVLAPTGEQIGEAGSRSEHRATTEWTGLQDGVAYAWYATTSDAGDEDEPGYIRQFEVFTARGSGEGYAESAVGSDAGPAATSEGWGGQEGGPAEEALEPIG